MPQANGTFEVKLTPTNDNALDLTISRLIIDKQFNGDLSAVSKGQMITGGTAVKNSAGYVAMEKVSGTLSGRTGTFLLQHNGTMNRGTSELSIAIVPDSGTGQLKGIAGQMSILISDGKHSYVLDYTM